MKFFATLFTAGFFLVAGNAFAADQTANGGVDDFGGAYFTAATPDALQDNGGALSEEDTMLSAAEALGSIEPAAGGEDVFILPDDEAGAEGVTVPGSEELVAPETAIVPGMDPVTNPAP